jgi:uncharacterized membrane protein
MSKAQGDVKLQAFSDQRLEIIIGNLLRYGVLVAATVVFAGGILFSLRHGKVTADYSHFNGEPENLRNIAGIAVAAVHGEARAIIQFGLLLLIATPVARVLFSVFGFALERDRMYVVITLIVLGILLYSLAHST